MGLWDDIKEGWSRELVPAPGSAAAEEAKQRTPILVAMSVPEALNAATMHMISRGYSVEARAENTITFVRHEGPNAALGCVLLLFFVVPGILYFLLAGRDWHTTVWAAPIAGGCRLLIGGDDSAGQRELWDWAYTLPKPQGGQDT